MKKRTMFTIAAIINLSWYTVAILLLCYTGRQMPPDTLTVSWYAAWTAELAMLYGIKKQDNKEA